MVQKVALARWSRTFSGTVSSGVPILQAIQISGQTAGNAVIQQAMDDVYDSVKKGGSIAKPLEEQGDVPADGLPHGRGRRGVRPARADAEKIADFYDAEVDAKIKALTSLIEPMMIVVVGAVVGFIVISMYLPIFSIYDKIK